MSKKRKMLLGMVNIVSHPHSAKLYVNLFQSSLKVAIPMGGDHRAMLGTCSPIGTNPEDGLQGSIFRYTELDLEGQWLDTITGKEVEPEELHKKVNVAAGLKPNFSIIWYNFFPKQHKLVFELERNDPVSHKKTTFSASSAVKFFTALFSKTAPKNHDIKVTAVQNSVTLNRIFGLKFLSRLEIMVHRPNPTDGSFEEEIERQLAEERASKLYQELYSRNVEGLKPSERTKALAQVALDNGYVEASGEDVNKKKIHFKTADVPIQMHTTYDPEQGFVETFNKTAHEMVASLHRDLLQ